MTQRRGSSTNRRATLFVTCLIDQFYPEVGESVVNVLRRAGAEVDVPAKQTCCGQPAFNSGYRADARAVAARFLDVFEGEGPIVVPSGSCGAMVRNFYRELFHDDPVMLARAGRAGERVREFSEFVVDGLGKADLGGELRASAVYHQCCHLLRELHVDRQPKALLAGIRGLEMRPLVKSEVCCGFGGTFAVKMPDVSTAIMNEKLENVVASGAEYLVASDSGCLMHMGGAITRRRLKVKPVHIAQLLDMATAPRAARS
ncbi:MAG: (Fe-S)-binding protein [Chloroflexi bacterium]|nr:(Fe-S)-binding protein [Chloroflexota bacterium]